MSEQHIHPAPTSFLRKYVFSTDHKVIAQQFIWMGLLFLLFGGSRGEVRGLGAMVAIELVKHGSAEQPDAELTRALVQAAARQGLIILSCGIYANVIRFLAPLTISDALLAEGLERRDAALAEVTHATPTAAAANA